jgi:hypothetical protein
MNFLDSDSLFGRIARYGFLTGPKTSMMMPISCAFLSKTIDLLPIGGTFSVRTMIDPRLDI